MFTTAIAAVLLSGVSMNDSITTKSVEYKIDGQTFEGFVAYDSSTTEKRPAVMIVHQWRGLTDYEKGRAVQLAELGYVAFAADVYGKGIRPTNNQESAAQAGKYRGDIPLFRKHLMAGYQTMLEQTAVDASKTAVMGYCFGGTAALELGRAGAPVKGIISFHGGLGNATPADDANIKGKVLICHGNEDKAVPDSDISSLLTSFRQHKVACKFVSYIGAVHSFTQPMAGNDPNSNSRYDEAADKESWIEMKNFFKSIFN